MKDKVDRRLAIWLYCGAAGILIQILLGGITRLTGSGLSITEWKPLLGAIPPLNAAEWEHSFHQYKQIAQYKIVNTHFNLEDYKAIYFWEWLHRNWARMLGLLFIIPYLLFSLKNEIPKKLHLHLIVLFVLGTLQGFMGWIMVKSGLNDTDITVSDLRLAIHFLAAVVLFAYTLWVAFWISIPNYLILPPLHSKQTPFLLLIVIILQLFFGALMAGSKAALSAPTWPDMNGSLLPTALYETGADPHWRYLLVVQFIHRLLAYLILAFTIILYYRTGKQRPQQFSFVTTKLPLLLTLVQLALGICSVIYSFEPFVRNFALLHQLVALLLVSNVLLICYLNQKNN